MNLKNILVLTLAVVFFASCGKKKESAGPAPEAAPTKTETSAPAPTLTAEEEAKKKLEAEKAELDKKAIEATRKGRGAGKRGGGNHQVGGKSSKGSDKSDKVVAHDKSLTGGKSKSGLIFTGSSADSILSDLVNDELMKPADEQDLNNALAASIFDIAYLIDGYGQLHLDVELRKGGGLTKIEAKANYEAGRAIRIVANPGMASEVALVAECLDKPLAASKCETLLVNVVQNGAQATAVLRQTSANIHYTYRDDASSANEFGSLVRFFENAQLDVQTPNKLQGALLHSFEVVNGKAGFKAIITGSKNQVLAFKGDLVVGKDLGAAGSQVEELTQLKGIDVVGAAGSAIADLGFIRTISDTKLVQNSTKGQITLKVNVNSASTGSKNSLNIQFTRVGKTASL